MITTSGMSPSEVPHDNLEPCMLDWPPAIVMTASHLTGRRQAHRPPLAPASADRLFSEKRTEFSLRAPVIDLTGASMPLAATGADCTMGAVGAARVGAAAGAGAGAGAELLRGEVRPRAARFGACMPSETMVAAPGEAVRTG